MHYCMKKQKTLHQLGVFFVYLNLCYNGKELKEKANYGQTP